MTEDSPVRYQRIELRNITVPQKLLVLVILATVGFGYLGALANLFAQQSGADGKTLAELEDFPAIYDKEGFGGLFKKINESLGVNDVIKTYHGSGAGVTELEAALNGTMRTMILKEMVGNDPPDEESKKIAETLRIMLIDWSKLPPELRKKAYVDGMPLTEDGSAADFKKFEAIMAKKVDGKDVETEKIIAETFDLYCSTCHSPGGPDAQARKIPLNSFETADAFCHEDRGMSMKQLALTTHVHLLGFSVLFAMTGFLFSLTSWPTWIRIIFVPATLAFQVAEIACWWLAKTHVAYAYGIFYLGGLIGISLGVQIIGTLIDLIIRRPNWHKQQ